MASFSNDVRGEICCTVTDKDKKYACYQAKGKHPRIKNWSDEATTDVAKITGWWNQTPLANIGIPMGEKSGLVALDVDTRHDGDKSLTDLVAEYGALPKTITATTGSGGKHYIFKYTEELALKNVVGFRDGLDVRTQGGLIIAAPSMHQSGNRYAWDTGLSLLLSVKRRKCRAGW